MYRKFIELLQYYDVIWEMVGSINFVINFINYSLLNCVIMFEYVLFNLVMCGSIIMTLEMNDIQKTESQTMKFNNIYK